MNREIEMELLKLVVMVISAVITYYVIPWIRASTDNEKMQNIMTWVEQGVHAAEQLYSAKTGDQKKEYVTRYVQMIVETKKINIKPQEVEMLIEAAVRQMNTKDNFAVRN